MRALSLPVQHDTSELLVASAAALPLNASSSHRRGAAAVSEDDGRSRASQAYGSGRRVDADGHARRARADACRLANIRRHRQRVEAAHAPLREAEVEAHDRRVKSLMVQVHCCGLL